MVTWSVFTALYAAGHRVDIAARINGLKRGTELTVEGHVCRSEGMTCVLIGFALHQNIVEYVSWKQSISCPVLKVCDLTTAGTF